MTVGDRIRERRNELGMKAETLAETLGCSRATIYRYEKGGVDNLPAEFIMPLAEALRTTPQYLLGVNEQPDRAAIDEVMQDAKLLRLLDELSDLSDERDRFFMSQIELKDRRYDDLLEKYNALLEKVINNGQT